MLFFRVQSFQGRTDKWHRLCRAWLQRAMTAMASTYFVPTFDSVSFTSRKPKPMVRYFGCNTTLEIMENSWFSCFVVRRFWSTPMPKASVTARVRGVIVGAVL